MAVVLGCNECTRFRRILFGVPLMITEKTTRSPPFQKRNATTIPASETKTVAASVRPQHSREVDVVGLSCSHTISHFHFRTGPQPRRLKEMDASTIPGLQEGLHQHLLCPYCL